MSTEEKQKAEELKKLLEQVSVSGSFESARITGRIASLARELLAKNSFSEQRSRATLAH